MASAKSGTDVHMDHEDEEDIADEVEETNGMVVLSTIIGSRTVTLDTVRYAIIHPAVRTSRMHRSGIMKQVDSPITPELENSQEGRVARVSSGLATYLYDIDDTGLVLHRASQGQSSTCCRILPRLTRTRWLFTLPARLDFVIHKKGLLILAYLGLIT